MEARRFAALALVLILTGSALAAQNQRLYTYDGTDLRSDGEHTDVFEATDVTGVQQHSIFVELIAEDEEEGLSETPFAAVVGLVKKCKKVRNDFDNAVLWFNDQFLFGSKDTRSANFTPEGALGKNAPDSDIFPGCYIPNGFAIAVPAGETEKEGVNQSIPGTDEDLQFEEVPTYMKLDRRCNGCIFDYEGSFYVTDPNGHSWLVDRLSYNLDRFDNDNDGEEEENLGRRDKTHPEETDGRIWVVHLQVNPKTQTGFKDKATWGYRSDGALRQGMPRNESVQDDPATPEDERFDVPSIEYDFMLTFNFDRVADPAIHPQYEGEYGVNDDNEVTTPQRKSGYNETGKRHGTNNTHDDDEARQGNSHPHNPRDNRSGADCGDGSNDRSDVGEGCEDNPQHIHSTVDVDIFYSNKTAHFVHENRYWDEHGAPPVVVHNGTERDPDQTNDRDGSVCQNNAQTNNASRRQAMQNRTFNVCDIDRDAGELHRHDGSQTMRPDD